MQTVGIVAVVMCVTLIASILFKPNVTIKGISFGTYWMVALTGALVLLLTQSISVKEIVEGLLADSAINPLKILVLFLAMTVQSIFLDELGMFRYLANVTLKKAKGSQKTLFFYLYVVVSILTVFTSNDIIILTFTPFICYFAKNAKVNPMPYLFTEFVAANTWSMALIIGNPTNVYLATANDINFIQYMSVMILPTVMGGLVAVTVLYLLFRKTLEQPLEQNYDDFRIQDKGMLYIGVAHLATCTVLLVVSSYIGLEMWLITLCFAISLFVTTVIYCLVTKKNIGILGACLKRAPWELIPFVISMFVFVLALDKYQLTDAIGHLLRNEQVVFRYGMVSFLTANLVNNIPMSVLFSSVVQELDPQVLMQGVYAAIVGSNIGAFFTPIGALAGIMWSGILKKHDVKMNFMTYIKYGTIISIPTLVLTLVGLQIVL